MYKTDNFFQVADGLKLFYRCHQPDDVIPDRVILCLPGVSRNHRDFEKLAQHLASSSLVICPDMRGRCYSEYDPDPRHYRVEQYVDDVWALLDHEQIDEVTIIGTSLGGIMAMLMACQQPTRINKVILNDIGTEIGLDALLHINEYLRKSASMTFTNWVGAVNHTKTINAARFTTLSDAEWMHFARRLYNETQTGLITPAFDPAICAETPVAPLNLWPLFDGVRTIPTLLLRGSNSDLLRIENVAEMQARKPDLKVVEIANRGHAPFLNERESIAAIDGFLARALS